MCNFTIKYIQIIENNVCLARIPWRREQSFLSTDRGYTFLGCLGECIRRLTPFYVDFLNDRLMHNI